MNTSGDIRAPAILAELTDFLGTKPPRRVSGEFLRAARDPLLHRFAVTAGILLFGLASALLIMAALSDTPPDRTSIYWTLPPIAVAAAMFVRAVAAGRKTRGILANGRIYTGRISKIRSVPQPGGWRTINRLTITYTDERGMSHVVHDRVGNEAGPDAVRAFQNGDNVDIIASPEIPDHAIFVMKLPYRYRLSSEHNEEYWFPQKEIGIGWGFPVTWQGWLVCLVFLAVLLAPLLLSPLLGKYTHACFAVVAPIAGIGLLTVAFMKGEK